MAEIVRALALTYANRLARIVLERNVILQVVRPGIRFRFLRGVAPG
jgi:hypothetical protein